MWTESARVVAALGKGCAFRLVSKDVLFALSGGSAGAVRFQ
jgi:hypothetical protein